MWILTIKSRQYWLLPGKRYTVGRSSQSKNDAIDIVIQESSVSRKHLVLEVATATEDAALHPSIRSQVHVTDLGSRFGTVLDSRQRLAVNERVAVPFKNDGIPLKIGSVVKAYLRWLPFIVSYSTGQSGLAHETMWDHALKLLKPLDVKLLPDPTEKTSVLVKSGTTLSTVYFALAVGIPIVNSHYLQALHDAALESSASGTEGSIVPDPAPYNPDPIWTPDPRRKTCLAGQTFHSPFAQHAVSLKPIIEAAGGVYTDAPVDSTLWVLQPRQEVSKILSGVKYIELISVFTAITKCRGIEPGDIRTNIRIERRLSDSASNEPKRQKKDADDGNPSQNKVSGRSRHARVNFFNALTSSQPTTATVSPTARSSPPGDSNTKTNHLAPLATEGDYSNHLDSTPRIPDDGPTSRTSALAQDNSVNSKRPGSAQKGPPTKRVRKTPTATDRSSHTSTASSKQAESDKDDDIEVLDYSTIDELAIVESSMDVKRSPIPPRSEPVQNWSGRSNFKKFKRTERIPARRRVEYDADASVDAPHFDDFAAPADHRRSSPSLRTELLVGTGISNDVSAASEEDLFVSTLPEDNLSTILTRSTPSRVGNDLSRELSAEADNAEDDGFSFRFS